VFDWMVVGFGLGFFSRSFPLPLRECGSLRAIVFVVLILHYKFLKLIMLFVYETWLSLYVHVRRPDTTPQSVTLRSLRPGCA
jgi:hypothetical protein